VCNSFQITKKVWWRGGVEIFRPLKTRKLLKTPDAKNAGNGRNCAQLERIWNADCYPA
jgi:hypothetical protein